MHLIAGVGAADAVPGLYVCGWVKRGPTGIIGTNLMDAEETVAAITRDSNSIRALGGGGGRAGLAALLRDRGVRVVDYAAWERLQAYEVEAGQAAGAPRIKVVELPRMLEVAGV